MKTKLYDWLWWKIGHKLWQLAARQHCKWEVNRRLDWMRLDNNGDIFLPGTKVRKISEKPFNNGAQIGVVRLNCINIQDPKRKDAVQLMDGSIVNIDHLTTYI